MLTCGDEMWKEEERRGKRKKVREESLCTQSQHAKESAYTQKRKSLDMALDNNRVASSHSLWRGWRHDIPYTTSLPPPRRSRSNGHRLSDREKSKLKREYSLPNAISEIETSLHLTEGLLSHVNNPRNPLGQPASMTSIVTLPHANGCESLETSLTSPQRRKKWVCVTSMFCSALSSPDGVSAFLIVSHHSFHSDRLLVCNLRVLLMACVCELSSSQSIEHPSSVPPVSHDKSWTYHVSQQLM